jgi:hypothetical protein
MPKKGFEGLYEKLLEPKPAFEEARSLTGGNPKMPSTLYEARCGSRAVVSELATRKRLTAFLLSPTPEERTRLAQALEDPDKHFARERLPLMENL